MNITGGGKKQRNNGNKEMNSMMVSSIRQSINHTCLIGIYTTHTVHHIKTEDESYPHARKAIESIMNDGFLDRGILQNILTR